ncbi:MAG: site-2 protease family protein [Acidobacteriota bacterium]|nr:site-2 protease family protein [Acidobacteriota bacterium]
MHFELALINVAILWMLTTPHEFAHAWVATKLGDDTPTREGRVTLYPLAHVDWLGTTILPFATSLLGGFFIGWGKPVHTDPSRLRFGLNGLALVAVAGPVSNVLFAIVLAALSVATLRMYLPLAEFLAQAARLSIYLAIFNLIPVPPLDGSKLLLAARIPLVVYNELARIGFIALILVLSSTSLGPWISRSSDEVTYFIFRLFQPAT